MTELVRYDAMCRAIDAAYEVDEVIDIRDKAVALEVYAKQALNTEAERRACEIRLRAERKAGNLRRKEEKRAAGQPKKDANDGTIPTNAARRTQLGITAKQDRQWQDLAKVPQEQFEAALAGPDKPTTSGIIAASKPEPTRRYDKNALWVSGTLRDFESGDILADDPARVFNEMIPITQDDCRRLVPLVIEWLERLIK